LVSPNIKHDNVIADFVAKRQTITIIMIIVIIITNPWDSCTKMVKVLTVQLFCMLWSTEQEPGILKLLN